MSIDLNYKNHELIAISKKDHFKCLKCGVNLYYSESNFNFIKYHFYGSNIGLSFKKLTCEENIIKNIIE